MVISPNAEKNVGSCREGVRKVEIIHGLYSGIKNNAMIVNNGIYITCPQITIDLPKNTPLLLNGDFVSSTVFMVSNIHLDAKNTQAMKKLLSGRGFQGIGQAKAELVLNSLYYTACDKNVEDFSYLQYEDILNSLSCIKLLPDTRIKIAMLITGLQARINLYQSIKQHGGNFQDADRLYQKYHTGSLDVLMKDPYKGIDCGLSFEICDKFASSAEMSPFTESRLDAIGKTLCEEISAGGHCCIEVPKALQMIKWIQKNSPYGVVNPIGVLNYLCTKRKLLIRKDNRYGSLVYPSSSFATEQGIVKELMRLSQNPERYGFWKYSGDWEPDKDQKYAISLIQTSGVKIITGGPGTGKTSVIREIIREFKKHTGCNNILLCAPTGAAAARINQSADNSYHAVTIHKLLDIREFAPGDYHYTYNRNHQLPKGLFIIDEMSMVSEDLFYRLLLAIPTGSSVILSGDVDQLQSVSSGTVLSDIIDAGLFEIAQLKTVHRQEGESLIVKNCQHIKNGDGYVETNQFFTVSLLENPMERLKIAADIYKYYNGNCQILTGARKGFLGKNNIDELITQAHSPGKQQYKNTGFFTGDKVMTIRNNYHAGYFNGDCGIITKVGDDSITIQFYEGLLELSDTEITDIEHAWACTVHKSQGNEYDNVIIILDPEYPQMLYRSLLFTAVSRARKNVHIISTTSALTRALSNTTENRRVTGLSGLLKEASEHVGF